jgi:hypothetical protein
MAPLPVRDGVYAEIESPTTPTQDHPSMLAALGFVPPTGMVDEATMRRTVDHVMTQWDWPSTWGWDYPMLAMTCARLGVPAKAIDALMIDSPKNTYATNGHNPQRPGSLPLYLPGNGGLLFAIALMAAGWDAGPTRATPGFPDDGTWTVRHEGLSPAP